MTSTSTWEDKLNWKAKDGDILLVEDRRRGHVLRQMLGPPKGSGTEESSADELVLGWAQKRRV
jgi:hypothetical protein